MLQHFAWCWIKLRGSPRFADFRCWNRFLVLTKRIVVSGDEIGPVAAVAAWRIFGSELLSATTTQNRFQDNSIWKVCKYFIFIKLLTAVDEAYLRSWQTGFWLCINYCEADMFIAPSTKTWEPYFLNRFYAKLAKMHDSGEKPAHISLRLVHIWWYVRLM